jgi:hypothetical protein
MSRAATVLLGALSRRLIVECEGVGASIMQQPLRSIASMWPQAITETRALALLPDPAWIAAIRVRIDRPAAYPEFCTPHDRRLRLVAAVKIYREILDDR